ncbi:hypothetical protein [Fusobacterium polymorphum]|uniref:Uncharacterized protein n=1 Tax=Fusobacterium nucleatum TaxID=851 RepID=A0A133NQW9_FUSNU|nr:MULTISPECIES: hypothetical protein [Fusobacterium]KXA18667.1 hypothetical protein HMPREF3221_01718 [Fusobacterium nucleatum]WDF25858.1 hypothetical protein PSC67_04995 [Fusobacterium nucleatum]
MELIKRKVNNNMENKNIDINVIKIAVVEKIDELYNKLVSKRKVS